MRRRWIFARFLLISTIIALFPLAYFVPTWKIVNPSASYVDEMVPPSLQKFAVDSHGERFESNLVKDDGRDPFDVSIKGAFDIEIVPLEPDLMATFATLGPMPGEEIRRASASSAGTFPPPPAPAVRSSSSTDGSLTEPSSRSLLRSPSNVPETPRVTPAVPPPPPPTIDRDSFKPDDDMANAEFRTEYGKLECKFPVLDPWDDSIKPFLSHPQPLSCIRVQPDITYVDSDGHLRYNESEYAKAISMYGNISCYYRHFDKLDENDHSLMYVEGGEFFDPPVAVPLTHESVEVRCQRTSKLIDNTMSSEVYWQIYAHPILTNKSRRTERTEHPSLSVLIIGVDSLSLSAFRRHLPLTYAYLRDVMGFHIFRGHHKIGDNSFPNQMAVLLGKRVADEHFPDMMDEVREDYRTIRFDHWPLIWKSFAQRGYETSFNEDTPHWGLFHYFAQGFVKKPVRHYYHQHWLALSRGKYAKYCFGNKPNIEIQLDLARKHLTLGQDRKWFDYVFATELFHQDEGYEAEKADPYLLSFFKDMYEGGYLNRTAVVFMSDHGHRYASLRQTLIGLLEERLPTFNIWFPEWFYQGNDLRDTLRNNTIRLTSHFDIHETLMDILDNNYRSSQRLVGARGLSMLYPIGRDRTCAQAGVPSHYCTCLSESALPTNDSSSIEAVQAAVDQLNLIVANSSSLCSQLTVSKIMRVELLGVSEKIARGVSGLKSAREFDAETGAPTVRPLNKLRVTFAVSPGNAIFEAIVAFNGWKSKWLVDGRIHRLNAYAATARCIHDRYLASYCICSE